MKRVFMGTLIVAFALANGSSAEENGPAARKAKFAERKAQIEAAKEKRGEIKARWEERKQEAEARRETATDNRKEKREEIKARWEERKQEAEARREKATDNRQACQSKRIEHGIKKGYLTSDEIGKLETQQKAIADLEAQFKSDGKLSKDEFRQLQTELNEASRCIWGEKHDTDGNQMPTYRLGKNVFAKDEFAKKMADENLTKEEARALLRDFRRTVELKRQLAGDLSDEERVKLQEEYNDLLNKYFEIRS